MDAVKYPFGWFSLWITLGIVVIIFCVMYFYVRRKKGAPHIDDKAGDEGED
jgi:hypothetical protein